MPRKRYIVGNWKMNGLLADSQALVRELVGKLAVFTANNAQMVICPPSVLLYKMRKELGPNLEMGGQDCHFEKHGAFTGDISAPMLVEAGCKYAILGHSERRQYHQELDALIQKKINAAHNAGLIAILCIGETLQQREQNETMKILSSQLAQALPKTATAQNTIVAYEPVWAIGTGKNAQSADIAAAHGHIRNELKKNLGDRGGDISILYGGSVKGANAEEILRTDDVDGALVGGASLIVDDFWKIYQSLPRK